VDSYRRLLTEAANQESTDGWQLRAIDSLRARVGDRPDSARPLSGRQAGPTAALIEILLYEGDVDEAWEVAADHGCDQRLWLTLARAREATHPLDPIPIYEREALAQIDTKKNPGYRSAVEYLARIHRLARVGQEPERFESLVATVRTAHKAKRNLMALLDQKGW
jgi:uncharacterized Zn finger protein